MSQRNRVKHVNKSQIKSPSDTTLYMPALHKELNMPTGICGKHIHKSDNVDNNEDHISNFVEKLRIESHDRSSNGEDKHHCRSHSRDKDLDGGDEQHQRQRSRTRSIADEIVLQAECFKALIDPPKGTNESDRSDVNMEEQSFSENVKELLSILRVKQNVEQDNDDDFFHVTCHIEPNLQAKISKGEFVDLGKLLPKTKSQILSNNEGDIEVIKKNGATYVFPETSNRDTRIMNVCRWEQAFRVYSAIYSEANPDCAAEIWQYVHVINTASLSYSWDNVSFYDVTFRQLMDKKPHRSWAKIYTQMWNLALTDRVSKGGPAGYQGNAGFGQSGSSISAKRHGDWRDRCCWHYNKGKCRNWNCKYDHRCSTKECGSYSNPSFQCPKKKSGNLGQSKPVASTSATSTSQHAEHLETT